MKCVILAGGSGSRFWPKSRNHRPKQLLNIIDNKSMLQITIDRLKNIKLVEEIFIITRSDLYDIIVDEISGIPDNLEIKLNLIDELKIIILSKLYFLISLTKLKIPKNPPCRLLVF